MADNFLSTDIKSTGMTKVNMWQLCDIFAVLISCPVNWTAYSGIVNICKILYVNNNNNFCNSTLIFFLQQINLHNKSEITTGKILSYSDSLQNLLKQFLYNKWLQSELTLTNYQLKFTVPFNMFSITTYPQDSSDKKLVYIITASALDEFTRLALSRHVNVMGSPLYCRLH